MIAERQIARVEPARKESWLTTQTLLENFSDKDKGKITLAYRTASLVYMHKQRLSGEQALVHSTSVADILLEECGIRDVEIICAALLHDTLEDTLLFGDPRKIGNSKRIIKAREQFSEKFSPRTAEMIIALSEPVVDKIEIFEKSEAKKMKYDQLKYCPIEVSNTGFPAELFIANVDLIKMADRLHNSRTFQPNPEKGRNTPILKIQETADVLWSIFRAKEFIYPAQTKKLLTKIKTEIATQCEEYKLQMPDLPLAA